MGDRRMDTDGHEGDEGGEATHGVRAGSDAAAHRQDPLAIAPAGAEQIPFELAVFRRVDDERIDVMVCGMWSGETPVLESHEAGDTLMVRVLGVDDDRREPQPYRVVATVELAGATVVEVRGTRHSERVLANDLAELAVVCGADPSMAGLVEAFLHCRGTALVRVEPHRGYGSGPARRSSITLVA